MTDMTEHAARRRLKTFRDTKRWSHDTLAADMCRVLDGRTVSPRTLARFEAGSHTSRKHTLEDITSYLEKVAA